jgi:DNA-binding NarL/FixJ family response regulator
MRGGTKEEGARTRAFLQVTLAMAAQRTLDEGIRVRWLRGPQGRELTRLAGSLDGLSLSPGEATAPTLEETDVELLRRLVEGLTNREIAARLEMEEEEVSRRMGEIIARLGATSRNQAAAFALREQVV